MNLDLIDGIFNSLRENKFMQNFLNELSSNLENNSKNIINNNSEEIPIIEKIISENNLTTGNKNSIIWNENGVILQYAENKFSDKSMYFVKDNKKTYWSNNKKQYNDDVYSLLKVENGKIEEIEINKDNISSNIKVNDVLTKENGNYVADRISTNELQEQILNMARNIIDKQNTQLNKYRKEGHLYIVTEELGNNRFLWDITDKSKVEFEEVNISQNLLNKATEGAVLKYENGIYEYYSSDGFEMIDKMDL